MGRDEQRPQSLSRRYLPDLFEEPKGCRATSRPVVHQDRQGRIWIGFHDMGLAQIRQSRL